MATETIVPSIENEIVDKTVDTSQTITLPRKIVYFQAALLGVIATTFFVFGMMVGSITSKNQFAPEIVDCRLSGNVVYESGNRNLPDSGAVVLILPLDKSPERRLNPKSIHPDAFDATDNDVIDSILELGGAVIRTDQNGAFNVEVDSPAKYSVIVISKHSPENSSLTKKQMAALSTYFMPVEDVRTGKAVFLKAVKLDSTRKKLGEIKL